jgi:tetratricopeptide (TPR) repeat protein
VTCSTDVQQEFDRGVALLHSFAFDASAKAFAAVTQQDASCGMAHWGVAMTRLGNPFNWPLGGQAIQEGWAAVEKAKAAGGKTPREQEYIAAIEALYKDAETIDHRTRAVAYERAMEQLSRQYPDDREAAIFYALAMNEPQQALQAFEISMQIEPHRFWGLYGAAQAAELMGDRYKARIFYTQLLALAERADSERPAFAATRVFLAPQ